MKIEHILLYLSMYIVPIYTIITHIGQKSENALLQRVSRNSLCKRHNHDVETQGRNHNNAIVFKVM